jgi:capsid protein
MKDFKPTFFDRAVCAVAPATGVRRIAARKVLHEFSYDGARHTNKRNSAPQNISPNSFDVQRDRLQLLREAEDLERNFAPAKHLNRKYALYTAPISYHAQTGDPELDAAVESYLNEEVFPNCDVTGRFDFFKMMEFGIMGCNRGGDYGWAFLRPELPDDATEEQAIEYDLKIQAVEPDRIGGIYQNVVSNDYVSGLIIGDYGQIDAFRVFHRSMTTSVYDNPVDIPASQFVHLVDPMRIDTYRGVSVLSTAVQNMRDIYEMVDFVKGKAKLASALTVFTNSNGGTQGSGAFDPYQTNIPESGGAAMQQDIQFGQINHMPQGADIKFPSSNSPSSEEQALITLLLKFVAMSYGLPYSFALDASTLGGVSSRLESEMAKAEFERGQRVLSPHAHRIKDTFLIDAIAKGIFPVETLSIITKGRWGYRPHPQPDIGKESTAAVNLYQTGLLDPMKYWVDNSQDPEAVAESMTRWAEIKSNAAKKAGMTVQEVFGAGPAMPLSSTESTTESIETEDTAEFSRHNFAISDRSLNTKIEAEQGEVEFAEDWVQDITESLATEKKSGKTESLQKLRVELDKAKAFLAEHKAALSKLEERRKRRDRKKPAEDRPSKSSSKVKAKKSKERNERHALTIALMREGKSEAESLAIAYDIIEKGQFSWDKLPSDIKGSYKD